MLPLQQKHTTNSILTKLNLTAPDMATIGEQNNNLDVDLKNRYSFQERSYVFSIRKHSKTFFLQYFSSFLLLFLLLLVLAYACKK